MYWVLLTHLLYCLHYLRTKTVRVCCVYRFWCYLWSLWSFSTSFLLQTENIRKNKRNRGRGRDDTFTSSKRLILINLYLQKKSKTWTKHFGDGDVALRYIHMHTAHSLLFHRLLCRVCEKKTILAHCCQRTNTSSIMMKKKTLKYNNYAIFKGEFID